jgi:hypothetical protein
MIEDLMNESATPKSATQGLKSKVCHSGGGVCGR